MAGTNSTSRNNHDTLISASQLLIDLTETKLKSVTIP